MLQFLDNYCATYSVLFTGFAELIALGWVYGADRFRHDIQVMMGRKISFVWTVLWKFVSPAFILVSFLRIRWNVFVDRFDGFISCFRLLLRSISFSWSAPSIETINIPHGPTSWADFWVFL